MPQSLSAVYIHLIFSTKERFPYLKDEQVQRDLHAYLGEISKRLDCPPIRVGGVEDHVHLLARFGRTITQAEWIKELKRVSNGWLKTEAGLRHFQWQSGYADFFRKCVSARIRKAIYRKPERASSTDELSR